MNNPAFNNNPALNGKTLTAEELNRIYNQPSATLNRPGVDQAAPQTAPAAPIERSSDPMTYEDTIAKTAGLFVIVLALGAVGWMFPALMWPGAIAGLVLGLVNSFKKEPSVPLIVGYAAAQGLFLGGISMTFEGMWPGIVMQAVVGTLSVFAVVLLLFRSGKVRTSPKMTKIVLVAMLGYLVFSLANFVMMLTGVTDSMFGARDITVMGIPLGVIIGLLAVFLASYSLVMDFEFVQNGVKNGVPRKYGWTAAFGLMVTLIWLYVEILRILAILRGND
ncbi:Bax inhibitor-1/YccA family protein [Leucobacter sp. M11]|uniref:Bax inhibitor-1/YccA family protein n=1 Tax=Leucobacter sp. M11 TaxID=2993565 RepID=UPI003FA581AB